MSILIATSLIFAHPFKFGFSFGRVQVLALQFNNKRLLLCQSPFSLNDIALYLPQLIVYRSHVHGDPHVAAQINLSARRMTFNSASFLNVPADAVFSRAATCDTGKYFGCRTDKSRGRHTSGKIGTWL
ncbi:hypothetical protein ACVWZR_007670 [Bradyrhizobium sp. i1.3.1]|uniref:hypothetical protein n=1 Tax=Bradyrhizobium sp. S3.2.12 TaxID=3156387 RepID=UPI0033935E98